MINIKGDKIDIPTETWAKWKVKVPITKHRRAGTLSFSKYDYEDFLISDKEGVLYINPLNKTYYAIKKHMITDAPSETKGRYGAQDDFVIIHVKEIIEKYSLVPVKIEKELSMSEYQSEYFKNFIKKLTQPSKTPSALNLESWSEFNVNVSSSDNYDRGYNAGLAQIAIEARKLYFKCKDMQEHPFVRRSKIEEVATLDRAQYEIREVADLPIVPDVVDDPRLSLKEIEKAHIIRVLHLKGFNKRHAAKTLGVTEKTIYNKIKEYNIETQPTILKQKPGPK